MRGRCSFTEDRFERIGYEELGHPGLDDRAESRLGATGYRAEAGPHGEVGQPTRHTSFTGLQ